MKTLTQNEVKDNFIKIFDMVKHGEEIIVKGNQGQQNFAVIMPFKKYTEKKDRPLGILKGKAKFKMKSDFKITDEELLTL